MYYLAISTVIKLLHVKYISWRVQSIGLMVACAVERVVTAIGNTL